MAESPFLESNAEAVHLPCPLVFAGSAWSLPSDVMSLVYRS